MDHPAAETLTTRCPHCDSLLPARATFCGHYGARLRPAVAQAPAPTEVSSSPAPAQQGNPPVSSSAVTVFISYSRQDGEFVARLQADLQARGIHIWIDHQGIKPGTPDWEEALRRAIRKATAVVLVASPESRQSRYVKDELRVAAMYQRPVYPIWAAGSEWMEAIPLGLDGRDNKVSPTDIQATMRNSLVAGNQSDSGPAISGSLTTEGYNLLQGVAGATLLDPGNKHGTDVILDPSIALSQFIDSTARKNNGPGGKPAPTQTLALLPVAGNPAIDVIPATACNITFTVMGQDGKPILDPVTKQPIIITTDHDQRGMPRPDDHEPFCDIGAYESSG